MIEWLHVSQAMNHDTSFIREGMKEKDKMKQNVVQLVALGS